MKANFRFSKASVLVAGGMIAAVVSVAVMPFLASAATLTRQLELGMSGSDVSTLQSFLGTDNTIYPQGIVSGYFGGLTKSAVSNFQARNNLPTVGRVGPMTLSIINAQLAGGISTGADVNAPVLSLPVVAPTSSAASVTWNTNELATGVVYYSTSPLVLGEHMNSVDVSGSVALTDGVSRTSQGLSISGLSSNTLYYYTVYVTDQAGNVSMTWPATFRTL